MRTFAWASGRVPHRLGDRGAQQRHCRLTFGGVTDLAAPQVRASAALAAGDLRGAGDQRPSVKTRIERPPTDLDDERGRTEHRGDTVTLEAVGEEPITGLRD